MTLPDERYRAVIRTREFLLELCDPKRTPRLPKKIRQDAAWCLRHYPSEWDMENTADYASHVFQKSMDPLYKMVLQHELGEQVKEDLEPNAKRYVHTRNS